MLLTPELNTIVTYNPRAVAAACTLAELSSVMEELQVRHLPVVDAQQRVLGMVSERDLVRGMMHAAHAVSGNWRTLMVEQVMAHQVLTLEQLDSPDVALRAMVAHGFHSMPVTDDGKLVGMITSSDFLREFSYGNWAGGDEPVRSRMIEPGLAVEGEMPLGDLLALAERERQEFIVVLRHARPAGVLARTALRQCVHGQADVTAADELRQTPVSLLLAGLPSLLPDMPLSQAAGKMIENRARALAVVDRARMLLGLLREDDVLHAMAEAI